MTLKVPLADLAAKHDDERHGKRAVADSARELSDAFRLRQPPRKEPDR